MKKFIYVIVTVLILSFCLGVTSFATSETDEVEINQIPSATFSEDFRTMYFNDHEYYQKNLIFFDSYVATDYDVTDYYVDDFDDIMSTMDFAIPTNADYVLSDTQKELVYNISLYGTDVLFTADISYNDGTMLSISYLRDDYIDEYDKFIAGGFADLEIDFEWPEGNVVKTTKQELLANEQLTLTDYDYWMDFDYYYIYAHSDDGVLTYNPGLMLKVSEKYYYFDFAENKSHNMDFFMEHVYSDDGQLKGILVHEITDEALLSGIEAAETAYYEDDFGYLYNDELAIKVSYFFLILLFGVVPAVIFIVALVFAIIKKGKYRKLLFTTAGFTLAEIITFIIFMIVVSAK